MSLIFWWSNCDGDDTAGAAAAGDAAPLPLEDDCCWDEAPSSDASFRPTAVPWCTNWVSIVHDKLIVVDSVDNP
jgi:hypothetical protein